MTDTLENETADAATAAQETPPDASLFERLGGIYGISGAVDVLVDRLYANVSANNNPHVAAFHEPEFDIVATEIAATLWHVGVPAKEHKEFMDIVEGYRSTVVGAPQS